MWAPTSSCPARIHQSPSCSCRNWSLQAAAPQVFRTQFGPDRSSCSDHWLDETAAREIWLRQNPGLVPCLLIATTGETFKAGVFADEGHANGPGRAVTLLADNDLGNTLVRRIRLVVFLAIHHQDHVGILLDSAGFAQVGHHRPLVGAFLDLPRQLRQMMSDLTSSAACRCVPRPSATTATAPRSALAV